MSSEGSVTSSGSRIQQFGLYRTIDARTEEFLRSSRRRQIRQGCACAAISTAITVTVVVSVILVYEYSINNSERDNVNKKNSMKPNWIGLMNDSDITSISSKFNKKINFDRTTLKLLPILLKALNKNRYLERILEEYSSSSPPYTDNDSTEATFTKDVFSGSKFWLKLPTTRHYSTDHKTSPLMRWKTPTQRLEYLTKIRKIRDYQRMLNYFDKMINDKVGLKKEFDYTERPMTAETVPMKKIDKMRKIQQLSYPHEKVTNRKETKMEGKEGALLCNCPKKLGLLLSKLISTLQDLVPQVIGDKIGLNLCKNKTKKIEHGIKLTTARTVRPTKHRIHELTTVAMTTSRRTMKKSLNEIKTARKCCMTFTTSTTSTSTSTSTSTTTTTTPTTTSSTTPSTTPTTVTETPETSTQTPTTQTDFPIKSFEDILIQEPTTTNDKILDYQTSEMTSTKYTTPQVTPTEPPSTTTPTGPDVKHQTTETIVPFRFISKSSTEKWLQAYAIDSPLRRRLSVPLYKEEEYDDYFNNKNTKTTDFENREVHSTESLKTITMTSPEDIGLGDYVGFMNNNPSSTPQDLDLTSMRKLADMIYLPEEKIAKVWKYTIEPELPSPSQIKKYDPSELQVNSKTPSSDEGSFDFTTTKIFPSTFKNDQTTTSVPDVTTDHTQSTFKYRPHSFNADQLTSDNGGDDDFQDEFSRPTESNRAAYKYKNGNNTKPIDSSLETMNLSDPWASSKTEEKKISDSIKSMLPALRPIYLEIQRNNDWRQDDHGDYDLYNFNSNIFDLPTAE